ncbi:MAG: response regulator transcription factor [Chloroflexota bacterium]|nr:response regulator transcription factor [Chloroflexota bacterium]
MTSRVDAVGRAEDAIRVLIVDDHPLYRDGLEQLLVADPRFTLVGSVGTGKEAVTLAEAEQPDVVVMDLQLPDLHGIEATRRIVAASPHIAVLVLTMFEDDDSVFAAMRAGARGYLVKGAEHAAIRRAVEAVGRGETILGPAVAQRVLSHFAQVAPSPSTPFPELTAREREVLDLVARGLGNQEIARRLCISHRTARNHVSNIFTKLQVADRAHAIVAAREAGLGHD